MNDERRIEVVDYDPSWPESFERLKLKLHKALGSLALAVEHVGSTAVPGLAAKPIIDLDVVIADRAALPQLVSRLTELGYAHEGDLGVTDREAFRAPPGEIPHHPYVCIQGSAALRDHIAFRNYLRAHADAAEAYARLKKQIAAGGIASREAYSQAKTEFVVRILGEAGVARCR